MTIAIGLVLTLFGFVISVLSLGLTSSTGARLGFVIGGIAISLTGILAVLNRYYVANALWRKR